jgi:hypothetical protein
VGFFLFVTQEKFQKSGASQAIKWSFGQTGLVKLNCSIIFVKRARAKLLICFESFLITPLQTETSFQIS